MDEVLGIPSLELVSVSTVATPQQNRLFEVRTPVENGENTNENRRQPGNQSRTLVFPVNGMDLTNAASSESNGENVKITFEDIRPEV